MMCYCGSSKEFKECCGAIISGVKKANTAEELMRSRYSAFVIKDIDYIIKTYAKPTRPIGKEEEIIESLKDTKWQKLEVLKTVNGKATDIDGVVEFEAYYKENGKDYVLHEQSFFVKDKDSWYYVNGI